MAYEAIPRWVLYASYDFFAMPYKTVRFRLVNFPDFRINQKGEKFNSQYVMNISQVKSSKTLSSFKRKSAQRKIFYVMLL